MSATKTYSRRKRTAAPESVSIHSIRDLTPYDFKETDKKSPANGKHSVNGPSSQPGKRSPLAPRAPSKPNDLRSFFTVIGKTKSTGGEVKKSSPAKRLKTKQDDQWYLDAGQKNFGSSYILISLLPSCPVLMVDGYQCPQCGMVYNPGQPSDVATHNTYHSKKARPVVFKSWRKGIVIEGLGRLLSSQSSMGEG